MSFAIPFVGLLMVIPSWESSPARYANEVSDYICAERPAQRSVFIVSRSGFHRLGPKTFSLMDCGVN